MKDELTYLCEGNLGGVGPSLEWAQNMGEAKSTSSLVALIL